MKNRFFLFFMVSIISLLISSCNDDEVTEAPIQVTTQGFARVGQSTAFVSAYITKGSISENAVTGFCWVKHLLQLSVTVKLSRPGFFLKTDICYK